MPSVSTAAAIIRAQFAMGSDNSFAILGEPGTGKTAVLEAIANDPALGFDAMLSFNASYRDPVDFLGTPVHRELTKTTVWYGPDDLAMLNDGRRWLLNLEEITDAEVPVQNALCRIIHEREINGLKLGGNVYIVASGNLAKHKSGARTMVTKLSNRMTVLETDVSFEQWKQDFALPRGVSPIGIAYLNYAPGDFCDIQPAEMVSATPRAWTRAFNTANLPDEQYVAKIAGDVGLDKATKFQAFRKLFLSLPKISEILADPKGAPVPTEMDVLYALAGSLSHHATRANFNDVLTYVGRFPTKDLEVVAIMDALGRDNDLKSTAAFSSWAIKNVSVFG